jgi:hypothetical protein
VLEDDMLAARAAAREAERQRQVTIDAERDGKRRAFIEGKSQEEQVLKVARNDVLSALVIAAELVPAMRALSKVIQAAAQPPDGSPPTISAKDAMGLMVRHSLMMQRAVAASAQVLDLSRLDRGEPTSIIGIGPAPTLSYEDALVELEEASELLTVVRARGSIRTEAVAELTAGDDE